MARDRAAAKQQARQEKIRLREATRLTKQQLQQAANQAARKGKKPRQPLSGAERHEQAMARDPDLYTRAQPAVDATYSSLLYASLEVVLLGVIAVVVS